VSRCLRNGDARLNRCGASLRSNGDLDWRSDNTKTIEGDYIGFNSWRNRRRKYLNRLRKLRATSGSGLRFNPYTLTHLVHVHLKNSLLGSARCPQRSQRNQSSPFCGAIGRNCSPSTQYGQRMIFCFFCLVVHWCKRYPPGRRIFQINVWQNFTTSGSFEMRVNL
jgi:hypothetical protein